MHVQVIYYYNYQQLSCITNNLNLRSDFFSRYKGKATTFGLGGVIG